MSSETTFEVDKLAHRFSLISKVPSPHPVGVNVESNFEYIKHYRIILCFVNLGTLNLKSHLQALGLPKNPPSNLSILWSWHTPRRIPRRSAKTKGYVKSPKLTLVCKSIEIRDSESIVFFCNFSNSENLRIRLLSRSTKIV